MKRRLKLTPFAKIFILAIIVLSVKYLYENYGTVKDRISGYGKTETENDDTITDLHKKEKSYKFTVLLLKDKDILNVRFGNDTVFMYDLERDSVINDTFEIELFSDNPNIRNIKKK